MKGIFPVLAMAGLVGALVGSGVITSATEYVTLYVPASVQQNTTVNASVDVIVNGTNETMYTALYARPVNASNWTMLCSWANFSIPSGYGNKTFSCSRFVNESEGNYSVRATVHVPTRTGCGNTAYNPEPTYTCGDYEEKSVIVNGTS